MRVREYAEEISIWAGYTHELNALMASLKTLMTTYKNALIIESVLKFITEWVAYVGAILSYVVVGIAVFSGTTGVEGPELGERISAHSFVCMYLIYR